MAVGKQVAEHFYVHISALSEIADEGVEESKLGRRRRTHSDAFKASSMP